MLESGESEAIKEKDTVIMYVLMIIHTRREIQGPTTPHKKKLQSRYIEFGRCSKAVVIFY